MKVKNINNDEPLTYEEAIPRIRGEVSRALAPLVREAFEHRIKKKITHEATFVKCYTCPSCTKVVNEYMELGIPPSKCLVEVKYCKFCGQALDWSN